LFYPLNVLYYLVPVSVAWALCMTLRMFFSALFMAMFVRSIGASRTGSIFSGVVFASCGFMTAWQGQPMSDGAIWLPFVCYAVHRLHAASSGSSIALAAFVFAMPVLAGHPETAAHVTLIAITLALMLWIFVPTPPARRLDPRFILSFACAGVLALGVASVQMIPTLEWLRQIGDVFKPVWPALPSHQFLGWVSRDVLRSPNSAGINIPEAAAYMAMISILASPVAVFHRSKFYVVFLSCLTLFAIAVAYGVEPMYGLISRAPVLGALKNSRLLLAANFGIAALSGLGISTLEDEAPFTVQRRIAVLVLVSSIFAIAFALVQRLQIATTFKVEFAHRPSFARTLLVGSLLLLIWKFYGGLRGRAFPIAVCGSQFLIWERLGLGISASASAAKPFLLPRLSTSLSITMLRRFASFRLGRCRILPTLRAGTAWSRLMVMRFGY
jgi:hypothetical protein